MSIGRLNELKVQIREIIEGSKTDDGKLNPVVEAIELLIEEVTKLSEGGN